MLALPSQNSFMKRMQANWRSGEERAESRGAFCESRRRLIEKLEFPAVRNRNFFKTMFGVLGWNEDPMFQI
jgi:hypothetical protein